METKKPKRRVLELVGSFDQGGSERQALHLSQALRDEGSFDVYISCLNRSGSLLDEFRWLDEASIPEFKLTSFYNFNFLKQVRRCADYMKSNRIELVHTHDFYTNVFGMAAGALAGVKVRIASKRETGMRSEAQRFVENRTFNLAHAILANSDAVKNYLLKSGLASHKITTIYNGLEFARVKPSETDRGTILRELDLAPERNARFVTIVANLRSRVKNHQMFLRAAHVVSENVENVNFIIAGEGELLTETKEFARSLGIAERTFFLGRCTKIAELLSITDVCVLSSESEGFSNSILEYMAAARPVVATAVGGASEAVADNVSGFLVASNDHGALAQRIVELLRDPEKAAKMGNAGRKIVEDKFSIDGQFAKVMRLYCRLLDQ